MHASQGSPSTPPRLTLRRGSADAASAETPRTSHAAARDAATAADAEGESDSDIAWRTVAIFGAGLVLGALLGAGTALLVAPASGFETRMRLARRARHARDQAADRIDDLGDRVRSSARRSRRDLERKVTMARWRAQDAWERKRYPDR